LTPGITTLFYPYCVSHLKLMFYAYFLIVDKMFVLS